MTLPEPTLETIRQRHTELSSQVVRTPTILSASDRLAAALDNAELYLKLELFQKTGTFKARGALSVIASLSKKEKQNGITAVSAGNHAIAAAWAARKAGISAKVVMIGSANPLRLARAQAEGAEIIVKASPTDAFAEVDRLVAEEGRTFVHPFEGPHTTLGAAGVGYELAQDVPDLDAVIVSIGGGGLISGVASAIKLMMPHCKVYGVEPIGAANTMTSLNSGKASVIENVNTIADSLAPPYSLPYSFGLCQKYVDEVITVSDEDICAGVAIYQEELKLAVEPAAGATLAAALGPLREKIAGEKVALVVCGANINAENYATALLKGRSHMDALLS